jgi:NAD(P)-dependent dehydrogenase (short-subunit alcohol dehydrogenase family)
MAIKSVAIVTGASQGIGKATAVRLARDFSAVVLAARNKDKLEETGSLSLKSGHLLITSQSTPSGISQKKSGSPASESPKRLQIC